MTDALLAQTGDSFTAAACAAWVHGRAAEIAGRGYVRGITFANLDRATRRAWHEPLPHLVAPELADLPMVGER